MRVLMSALANKTYFNKPGLTKQMLQYSYAAKCWSKRQDWL